MSDDDSEPAYPPAVERLADTGLLTARQAQAYVLRDVEDLDRQETAARMDCSTNVVDKHLRAARDKVEAARQAIDVLADVYESDVALYLAQSGEAAQ